MAAYPTLPTEYGLTQNTDSGRQINRASNGAARGRVFFTAAKSTFKIKHKALTTAQLASFTGHYAAHLDDSFSYTNPHDSASYTVIYASEPTYTPEKGTRTTVDVELTEV